MGSPLAGQSTDSGVAGVLGENNAAGGIGVVGQRVLLRKGT
jgi:hypothetical protein